MYKDRAASCRNTVLNVTPLGDPKIGFGRWESILKNRSDKSFILQGTALKGAHTLFLGYLGFVRYFFTNLCQFLVRNLSNYTKCDHVCKTFIVLYYRGSTQCSAMVTFYGCNSGQLVNYTWNIKTAFLELYFSDTNSNTINF